MHNRRRSASCFATATAIAVVILLAPGRAVAEPIWASDVVEAVQTTLKNGNPVSSRTFPTCDAACRADPQSSLGPADSEFNRHDTFFGLGFGGHLLLTFPGSVSGTITVYETTWGNFPEETANVFVSADGETWTQIGVASNNGGSLTNEPIPTVLDLTQCIRFLLIRDTTDPSLHGNVADAFDVDAVSGEFLCDQEIAVDIKPQSCPNPLNVKNRGLLPVAILGTPDLDVTTIDPVSIRLEGVAPRRSSFEDVAAPHGPFTGKENCEFDCIDEGPDGSLDLTLKFGTQEVADALGDVEDGDCLTVVLTGNLKEEFGGTPIQGEDVMIILKR